MVRISHARPTSAAAWHVPQSSQYRCLSTGASVSFERQLQNDLDTPTVFSTLGLSGSTTLAVLVVYWDARKMMRQYHQTEYGFKWLGNRSLAQRAQWIRPLLIHTGKDNHANIAAHAVDFFTEVTSLVAGRHELTFTDAATGTRHSLGVEVLFVGDGAGKRSLLGLTTAASTYPHTYRTRAPPEACHRCLVNLDLLNACKAQWK
jgi:hypothetical protein